MSVAPADTALVHYPQVEWTTGLAASGVALREVGEGRNLFLFDGMNGGGEASLELVLPVLDRLKQAGRPHRLILFDYKAEEHATLEDLVETARSLVVERAGGQPCVFWAQSFGNLIATAPRLAGSVPVERFVLVSSFTGLSQLKVALSLFSLALTPTWLYRATIRPLGRFVFGPPGDQPRHPFFDALAAGTPQTARRRTSWLRGRDFRAQFANTPAPTKVWLGERDRLIRLEAEKESFAAIARERSSFHLQIMKGCGHLVLDSATFPPVWNEIFEWLRP